jgi:hypothetical protein
MELKDFLYNPDLNAFTRLLTKEIMQFEQNNCKFLPINKRNYAQWLPHDDFFEWDPSPNDICYGRYYTYQPLINTLITKNIEIWVGLEILKDRVFFSLWIEKTSIQNYGTSFITKHGGLKTGFSELLNVNTSSDYFIIRLLDTEFSNYCSYVKGISVNQTGINNLQKFFTEVLF